MNDNRLYVALTDAEVNLVLTGLGELPAKMSFNLLGRLSGEMQQELQRRQQQANPPLPPAPPMPAGYAADDD